MTTRSWSTMLLALILVGGGALFYALNLEDPYAARPLSSAAPLSNEILASAQRAVSLLNVLLWGYIAVVLVCVFGLARTLAKRSLN